MKRLSQNILTLLTLCISLKTTIASSQYSIPSTFVMPWMCLEFCSWTPDDISNHLLQVSNLTNSGLINAISFERYGLGPNGTLVTHSNLTNVIPQLSSIGIDMYPMISSYPYPPQFLNWMRTLWSSDTLTQNFIHQCVSLAQKNGYKGRY